MKDLSRLAQKVICVIEKQGILLLADSTLPSVCSIIAGKPIQGSWWGHESGKAIFNTSEEISEHPDVICVKLLRKKLTYVHRHLWPELLTIATAKSQWQRMSLSPRSKKLFAMIERQGILRLDELPAGLSKSIEDIRPAAKELENRLLVIGGSIHTDSGSHTKVLQSWSHWAEHSEFKPRHLKLDDCYAVFEEAATKQGLKLGRGSFPWR